jgi:hypothetical protein
VKFNASALLFAAIFQLVITVAPHALDLRNVLTGCSLTTWGPAYGLPSSEVLAIAEDRESYLWLGQILGWSDSTVSASLH